MQKRWSFGFGTVFSLIVIYFIFLYSKDKGWTLLAFISKWYLIIVGGLIALSLGIAFIIILISLFVLLMASLKLRKVHKKQSKIVDVDYKIKD